MLAALASFAVAGCGEREAVTTMTKTVTTEEAATTQTTSPKTTTARSSGGGHRERALHFEGNGDTRLPPFRVRRGGSVLRWKNTGEVFSLFGRDGTLVDSVASKGQVFLPSGVQTIAVVAAGTWEIVVPGARRVKTR